MGERPPRPQGRIFISYRREETAYPAGWLFDRLAEEYGGDHVFKDVDSIELGDDFVEVITAAVGSTDVLLALIGDEWLTVKDEDGRRRLDNPDDFVRLEIEAALKRNVRVIPILVDGARMPRAGELPPSLAPLARRHALELSPSRFAFDTSRLLKVLDKTFGGSEKPHGAPTRAEPVAPTPAERRREAPIVAAPVAAFPGAGWRRLLSTRRRLVAGVAIAALAAAALVVGILAATADGEAVFEDDFSTRAAGWDDSGSARNGPHYANGAYRIYADQQRNGGEEGGIPRKERSVYPSAPPDLRIKVEARTLGASEGEGGYGVVCRDDAKGDNGYALGIWGSGVTLVKYFEADPGFMTLRERFEVPAINPNGTNEIEAVCVNDERQEAVTLVLSVNGEEVLRYTDADDPFLSGSVGLFVVTEGALEAEFDNFKVEGI